MPAANPREYQAAWRARNRASVAKRQRAYYERNRERCKQWMRDYRARMREKADAATILQSLLTMKIAA